MHTELLEETMNTTLFVRHSRGVHLTPEGELLQQFCDVMFLRIRDLEKKLVQNQELSGVLRIGTFETLGELFWPRALIHLRDKFPDIAVELTTENPESHMQKLGAGALDILVDAEPRLLEQFHSQVLYTDRFGLFVQKDSPFLRSKEKLPASYVKRATDLNGVSIEDHLSGLKGDFELRYAVESFTMVRALVCEGVCIGVLPLRLATPLVKTGAIVPYHPKKKNELFGEHRICATCSYDMRKDPRISKVIGALKSTAKVT